MALIGRRQAQAHANGGGFARAVGPDHAQAFTGCNLEGQLVHHQRVAITFGQVPNLYKGMSHGAIVADGRRPAGPTTQASSP
jgi:hypothetical protein